MLGCCLLTAIGVLGTNCCAQTSANAGDTPPASSKVPGKKKSRLENGIKKESSSESVHLPDPNDYNNTLGLRFLENLAQDQEALWTSPARVRLADATWIVPLGGLTAGFIATDRDTSLHLSQAPSTLNQYKSLSDYGIAAMAGGVGALYFWGRWKYDDRASETALLSGEAAIDSLAATTAIKYTTDRERPYQGSHDGAFWGGGDSFPSDHATVAWAVAGVLSHEYPGPLSKLLAFGAASAISMARIRAEQHFPSDVLVGSAMGWFIGQHVYDTHHDPELGGETWENLAEKIVGDHPYDPKDMGSPYIPMDSWIYPAFDRLEAFGYVPEGFLGQRPWTRMECARLLGQAIDLYNADAGSSNEAGRILQDLNREFESESESLEGGDNRHARLESAYSRVTEISGQPLGGPEAYDFGQTLVNDYGRPYEEGTNVISGGSGWASAGPFFGYARVEYQYAPSGPALPLLARQTIQQVQNLPAPPPGAPTSAITQATLLEGYVGMQLDNWQITFGKQELWWGADQSGPMLFSTNAAPIEMLQITRVKPFVLPGVFSHAGPIRVQYFLGRLTGQNFVFSSITGTSGSWSQPLSDQPMIQGWKISLKPSPNFEMGMGITTLFAGTGVPFTLHKWTQAIFSSGNGNPGTPSDPGDRRGGFDFAYRVPRLRNWLTLYADTFTDDELSPWRRWDKAAVISGLYLSHFPKISKLDLRVEGLYTDPPGGPLLVQHGFFYYNGRFRSGYTNGGNLIGSWVGRQGQGFDAWSTYWFSPKSNLQFNFRHQKVSQEFIPDGGTLTDAGAHATLWIRSVMSLSAAVQYETWDFPVISPRRQSDVTTSIGLTFWPGSRSASTTPTNAEMVGAGRQ